MLEDHMNIFIKSWMEIMKCNSNHQKNFGSKLYHSNSFDDTFRHMRYNGRIGDYPKCYIFRLKNGWIYMKTKFGNAKIKEE